MNPTNARHLSKTISVETSDCSAPALQLPIREGIKTGCGTCRERKITCDKALPVCNNCKVEGRECLSIRKKTFLQLIAVLNAQSQIIEAIPRWKPSYQKQIHNHISKLLPSPMNFCVDGSFGPVKPFHISQRQEFSTRKLWVHVDRINTSHLPSLYAQAKDDQLTSKTFDLWLTNSTQDLDWFKDFFDKRSLRPLEKSILFQICDFHSQRGDTGLGLMLELTLLSYILRNPFKVPQEDLSRVSRHFSELAGLSHCHVFNDTLTEHIKRRFTKTTTAISEYLNTLFSSNENMLEGPILAFYGAFLCIFLAGQSQDSGLRRILRNDALTTTMEPDRVYSIEDELVTPIIGMCFLKFQKLARLPILPSPLFDRLRDIMIFACHRAGPETLDLNNYRDKNIPRLLSRLYTPMSIFFQVFLCTMEGCTANFTHRWMLDQHIVEHEDMQHFFCIEEGCNRRYTAKEDLIQHQIVHQDQPNFIACSATDCNQYFTNEWYLHQHFLITHEAEMKPFCCPLKGCDKRFIDQSLVDRHVSSHLASRLDCGQFNCPRKGRNGFVHVNHRILHERRYHQLQIG